MSYTPVASDASSTTSPVSSEAPQSAMGIWALRSIVLVAGMTTMATEMSASRLLAPFFGTSVMVWANIIGLILIYLSIGYWYGGRLADRYPHARGLCTVTLGAAITIAIVPFVAQPVLRVAAGGIDSLAVGSVVGSFLGSLLLFSVPITLLGMVPPFAVRLALRDIDHSGQVSGSLYALSTIGSIIGTFGSVLLLIPLVGTRRTMLVFGLALAVLSVQGFGRRRLQVPATAAVAIAALLLVPVGQVKASTSGKVIFEDESLYQFVQVVQEHNGRRLLQLNEGWAVHSVYDPDETLTGGIWDHFLVLPSLRTVNAQPDPQPTVRMLIVGNAAGSTARIFRRYQANVEIDGVEIDPLVSKVGERYFDMAGDNLEVHAGDGRPFLAASGEKWDVIHIDAYRQPYIPFYLTTREFFTLVHAHLNPGGVLAINVGSAPGDNRIQEAVSATMRSVFPTVHRYQAESYNEVIVANVDEVSTAALRSRVDFAPLAADKATGELFRNFAAGMKSVPADADSVLTDDKAPVEWMTDRMIVNEAARGA